MEIYLMPESDLVGTFVYTLHTPNNIGKIIKVTKAKKGVYGCPLVLVKWVRPNKTGEQITKERQITLQNFNDLIDDHKKKLKTHQTRLKRAKKILGE